MNLLNKLTIKNLKLNKKRTIVTIIGIMLSVALITAVSGIYASAVYSLTDFEKTRNGDFHLALYNMPQDELDILENNRNIEKINLTQNIGYAKINSKNESKPYAYIKSFTKSSLENLSIRLTEGRMPKNDREILIPTHLNTNGRLKLNVNDEITLEIGKRVDSEGYELNQNNPYNDENNEKIVDTITKTYKIVGIIERPAGNIENYSAPGYTFITYMNDNKLNESYDVYARFTDNGLKNIYKIVANIINVDEEIFQKYYLQMDNLLDDDIIKEMTEELTNAKYEYGLNEYLIGLETDPIGSSSLGGLGTVVAIVIGIIVFTSVFCIKNSFDISITEKIKQYGMLRSVGATKKQIKKNVFYEASALGIIGIPLGILLGLIAVLILIVISNYFLKDMLTSGLKLKFSFSPLAITLSIILGIITIYFSAFKSARRASKVSPIDSIRNSANINLKKIKSSKIIKKTFGIGGEIAYKNLKRNKKKYRTTVISIAVSVFVFIALSSFMQMAFETVKNELNLREAAIYLSANNFTEEEYKKIIETVSLDNIEKYTILRQTDFEYKENYYRKEYTDFLDLKFEPNASFHFTVVALGDKEYKEYIKSIGLEYNEIKDKAILHDYTTVTTYDEEGKALNKYMKVYNLEKGSIINGTFENQTNYNIEIGATSEKTPFGMQYYDTSHLLIISDELFDKITTSDALAIYYKTDNADKLQDDIDEYLKDINYTLNNHEENARIMNSLFTLVGIFLYGFIIVIILIGITNIFNTITTNMKLRQREFATLKSVGMTKKEFNRMIRLESLFMGLKSLIFGIPIGLCLSYLIYHFLNEESGHPYNPPVMAILTAVITVFILIFIIMKYSVNKINKQNIIETIRNENI